jgi:anti-anti-sigma regulatory factor
MNSLDVRFQRQSDGLLVVFLSGAIDEQTDFMAVFPRIDSDAVLNLSGIVRLNSVGVHRWLGEISTLSKEHHLVIEACSYVVALQAACVASLFGAATVRSTLAPYFCSSCNDARMVLITVSEVANGVAPVKHCSSCGGAMAFDELDTYFAFLTEGRPK